MKDKLKNNLFTIVIGLFTVTMHSQQIGEGLASQIADFTIPLNSGAYNGPNAIGGLPESGWQHLFVVRHPNPSNNYQLQIASTIELNDRLYFRKLASGAATSVNSNWHELATRGANNFVGDQVVMNGGIMSSKAEDGGGNISLINSLKNSSGIAQRWGIFNTTGVYGNSLQFWAYDNLGCAGGMCVNRFTIMDNGNVGIGTTNPTSKLTVAGNISSREVKVTVDAGADFVFENEYELPSLESVAKYIKENKHLPEIASAKEMQKEGINLSEMNIKLLQKIEELTLYSIEQNDKIKELQIENKRFLDIEKRLEKIEKVSK